MADEYAAAYSYGRTASAAGGHGRVPDRRAGDPAGIQRLRRSARSRLSARRARAWCAVLPRTYEHRAGRAVQCRVRPARGSRWALARLGWQGERDRLRTLDTRSGRATRLAVDRAP